MKGTPQMPMCGFSGLVCQAMEKFDLPVFGVNILDDPDMRQGIKDYTNWPTLPQLYIKGEFIGGADIIKEMYLTGELKEFLTTKGFIST
jgi:monothiol glutaredoxin